MTQSSPEDTAGCPMPIAIVGMACRTSGDVRSPEDLWTMLARGRDGWRPVPEDRFSIDAFYHPNPQKKGCLNPRSGYFMDKDFSIFDAPFFNITEQEANAMDPNQRQLLEITYEALENSGLSKHTISGSKMGVFVGAARSDYRVASMQDMSQIQMYDATGNHPCIQAGRISYYFNLNGPAVSLDTACSSSLYALHAAVQSIRAGDSTSAIVAASNMYHEPDDMVSMSMLGLYNPDGKTFAFDHRGTSGFASGEGAACVVLKPLHQAIHDNDNICSIIVNTGTNQDGKTIGLTTPSSEMQEKLIREVYQRANIDTAYTGFVETHGTGTKVGDPLEASALHRVFGNGRTRRNPLYIGSVKTNIGHLENASGLASVIKASLMLERGMILPNINFEKENAAIPLEEWNMTVPTSIRQWPRDKRYVSINNFGFGGSNAHVVLERPARKLESLAIESGEVTAKLFVLSGHDESAAKRNIAQLGVYIEQNPEVFQKRLIRDIAYTLGQRRSHLAFRIAIAASSSSELAASLNEAAIAPILPATEKPTVAFVLTGQGAQWPQMGKQLLDSYPVFLKSVKASSAYLQDIGAGFSLMEELLRDKSKSCIDQAHISQPICTAIQLGLIELLKSWGILPSMVIGHSSGEIAAAYAAGAIDMQSAMAAAYYRGKCTSQLHDTRPELRGAMLAVGAGPSEVRSIVKSMHLSGITIACENSPNSITASGDEVAIDVLSSELDRLGVFNRKLRVEMAYHSPHMKIVDGDYRAAIKNLGARRTSDVAFYSSLLGGKLDNTAKLDASYWTDNLTRPVLFSSALQAMCRDGRPNVIVEIGPHGSLEGPIRQNLKSISSELASRTAYHSVLLRGQDATVTALKLAGRLFTQGHNLNFSGVNLAPQGKSQPALVSDMPPYPWSEHKYWVESRSAKGHRFKPFARHDLLGLLDDSSNETEPNWRNIINTDDVPWLKGHKMQDLTTFPLAGYLTMAVEAAKQRAGLRGASEDQIVSYRFRQITVFRPLILDEMSQYETNFSMAAYRESLRSGSGDWDEFHMSSWHASRGWIEHCRGLVGIVKQSEANRVAPSTHGDAFRQRTVMGAAPAHTVDLETFYTELDALGICYTGPFQLASHEKLQFSGNSASSTITVPDTATIMPHHHETPSTLHSSFVDLFLQVGFVVLGAGRGEMASLYMPNAIGELEVSASCPKAAGETAQVVVTMTEKSGESGPAKFDIHGWHNEHHEPVLSIRSIALSPVSSGSTKRAEPRQLCYNTIWEPLGVISDEIDRNDAASVNGQPPGLPNSHANGSIPNQLSNGGINGHHNGNASPTDASGNCIANDLDSESISGSIQTYGSTKACAPSSDVSLSATSITIIHDAGTSNSLVSALAGLIEHRTDRKPAVLPLEETDVSSCTRYVFMNEISAPVLHNMNSKTFDRVQKLLLNSASVLWVSRGAYRSAENPLTNLAQGLLRTIRSESGKVAAMMDLDPHSRLTPADQAELIVTALEASLKAADSDSPIDFEFAEDNGQILVPRYAKVDSMNLEVFRKTQPSQPYLQAFGQPGRRLAIEVGTYGALDSLYWKDDKERTILDEEIEIRIAATGMNFKDVVIANGQVSSPYLGIECAGTVTRVGAKVTSIHVGDRVCAMTRGAYSTYGRCHWSSAATIPENMSFETAASVPVVFCTAYYGLIELAHLKAGEKILIHAGAGGVGQAAIQLAQIIGAEIYTTVGSVEKKQYIMEMYGMREDHIFYSRDTSFAKLLMECTGGCGVDVVINSLAGDILRESWACMAPFGRFIEIGKRDIYNNTRLEMAKFEHNCSFSSVDLTLVASLKPRLMTRIFNAVVDLLVQKVISPITPITTVSISEVELSLRKLQSGKTSGKLVVRHSDEAQVKMTHTTPAKNLMRSEATYIIIGGTGGLGLSLARWIAHRGAGHLVLLSRTGRLTPKLKSLISEARALGTTVRVMACDVGEQDNVNQLLSELQQSLPPVRGIIHAAMVLRDVLYERMTCEDFDAVVRSKTFGSWNFHQALAHTPLDFFVLLSSVAGIVGNRGQAAYAAANTFLDALTAHRRRRGLPSTCLNLTAVHGVGYLSDNANRQEEVLKNLAGKSMSESEVIALVESAVEGSLGSTCSDHCITGLDFQNGTSLPYFAADGRFATLRAAAVVQASAETNEPSMSAMPIGKRLQTLKSIDDAVDLVTGALSEKLSAILMLHPDTMEAKLRTTTITEFGLDSLNAIELRNWVGKELQAHLQVLELLSSGTVPNLARQVLGKTRIRGEWSVGEKQI